MIRTLNIIMVAIAILMLVGVYALKYSVEETASSKSALIRQIDRQQADLSLLKADWAYLNQPAHIGPIVQRHEATLGLQNLAQEQFGRMDNLPMRLQQPDTAALDNLFESLDAGFDPIGQTISEN